MATNCETFDVFTFVFFANHASETSEIPYVEFIVLGLSWRLSVAYMNINCKRIRFCFTICQMPYEFSGNTLSCPLVLKSEFWHQLMSVHVKSIAGCKISSNVTWTLLKYVVLHHSRNFWWAKALMMVMGMVLKLIHSGARVLSVGLEDANSLSNSYIAFSSLKPTSIDWYIYYLNLLKINLKGFQYFSHCSCGNKLRIA